MIFNFQIVKVDCKYCDYLRTFDHRVSYNSGQKELRPFIGILFEVNSCQYFAPLSSPKLKHLKMKNKMDFVKIDGGKLGAVNFNNMIPVFANNYNLIDLNTPPVGKHEIQYQNLLKSQLLWLNRNEQSVKDKAIKLYNKYKSNELNSDIKSRCCDFILLEQKCIDFNS